MLNFTSQEVLQAYESASNFNAACKKFLKHDAANDPRNVKFAKGIKQVFEGRSSENKLAFIEKHFAEYQPHLLLLGRYSYVEGIDSVSSEVITKYAEDFNATYRKEENAVVVSNPEKFKQIVSSVEEVIDAAFDAKKLPNSSFIKAVLLNSIFDLEVLKEVLPLLKKV